MATRSSAQSLLSNSFYSLITGLSNALTSLVTTAIIARSFGSQGSGAAALLLWFVMVFVITSDSGVGSSLARYLPEYLAKNSAQIVDDIKLFLLKRLVITGLGVAAVTGCHLLLRLRLGFAGANEPSDQFLTLLLGGLCCLIQLLYIFSFNLLRGIGRYGLIMRLTVVGCVLQLASTWFGGHYFGLEGALWGYVVGSTPMALCFVTTSYGRRRLAGGLRNRIGKYALASWAAALLSPLLWCRVDVIIVQYFFGVGLVGLLSIASAISNLLLQLTWIVSAALITFLSSRVGLADKIQTAELYASILRLSCIALFPACFGAAALTPIIIPSLYGSAFQPAVDIGVGMAISSVFVVLYVIGSNAIQASEKAWVLVVAGMLGALCSAIPGAAFIAAFGLPGALASRFLAQGVTAFYMLYHLNRLFPGSVPVGTLARSLVASAVCGGTAALASRLPIGVASEVVVGIVAGVLTYGAMLRLLHVIHPEDGAKVSSAIGVMPPVLRRCAAFGIRLLSRY